jgi:Tfp pilus assembly protein PilE
MKLLIMKALSDRFARRQVLPSQRKPGTTAFTLLEIIIVITITRILAGIIAARYQKYVQRARETTRKQDIFLESNQGRFESCQALPQNTLDKKQMSTQSSDDLVRTKWLSNSPTDTLAVGEISYLDCGEFDMHMDPIQTIPGVRNLYANSTDKMIVSRHSVER